jgi:hypothetical protein
MAVTVAESTFVSCCANKVPVALISLFPLYSDSLFYEFPATNCLDQVFVLFSRWIRIIIELFPPCNPFGVNWRFGGTCRLHIQGQRISQARNQHEESRKQVKISHAGSYLSLFFHPEDGSDMFSETSVDFQYTTRRYILEDRSLHNHRRENIASYIMYTHIIDYFSYHTFIICLQWWCAESTELFFMYL